MSNYFTVDGEVEAYPRPRFTVPIDENQDMSDSKFVTNAHLGRITFNRPIADWDSLMSKNDNGDDDDGRSMAYSLLAGLPPVYGLYVGFLGPLLYSIFGHCTQLSIGELLIFEEEEKNRLDSD
ncbi:unnamed protein product [Trichobilharzia regenti]|nr:unnamed protein product [Trichobilharzia regenti]